VRVHARYNPEAVTQYNIVPGLMGVVLTMTMVMITALAITRERERGTMENLLSMPARPFEVLLGKIVPYILVGYVQVGLILAAAHFLFDVPTAGSLGLLLAAAFLFIAANLAVGITFSTLARNQLQAMQMSFFFFLPSLLLSGFMFPFRGMPGWAQAIGEVLPLTHFLRVVRGILLKGNGLAEVGPELWPVAAFAAVARAGPLAPRPPVSDPVRRALPCEPVSCCCSRPGAASCSSLSPSGRTDPTAGRPHPRRHSTRPRGAPHRRRLLATCRRRSHSNGYTTPMCP
jgi:hypothetical protein